MIHARFVASALKIQYIANIRLPTEKAHGVQIMKACEAFGRVGVPLELVVPNRLSSIKEDAFDYYHVEKNFHIKRLFTLDIVAWGHLGFLIQSLLFGVWAAWHVRRSDGVIYGRDEIVLAVIGRLTNKKIVWESHDGAWNRWALYLAARAERIVVVTKGAIEFYKGKGIAESKMSAVPNGIDLKDFAQPEPREAARNRLGLSLDKIIALYIGRLDGWKGTDTLLEASKGLPQDIVVAIIGGEREQIEQLRAKYPHVIFVGYRPYRDLASNQAAGDMLILPNTATNETSVQFSSPLKLFAYMAAKRPIIASDLPSIREIISDDSAVFFEPDNAASLRGAIIQVAGDLGGAQKVADRAYADIGQYSWERRAEKIKDFIKEI
jgi:glycosyltransferase involved in cell wall biosynthesis